MKPFIRAYLFCLGLLVTTGFAQNPDAQPLKSQVKRITQALQFLGAPLPVDIQTTLMTATQEADPTTAVKNIQEIMDRQVLATIHINPESRVKSTRGPAAARLHQQGWSAFLIKVDNEAGVTSKLNITSPNAAPVLRKSRGSKEPKQDILAADIENRWLDIEVYNKQPLTPELSGLEVEYRIVLLHSRDAGKREAILAFDVGQGSQDLGFRSEIPILFDIAPATQVVVHVLDEMGDPTTAHFTITDRHGRVYPARNRRLAPDFFFHDQVYRHNGESIQLPAGEYVVKWSRGPEYLNNTRKMTIPSAKEHHEHFSLKRWIKLADHGWYSGDHHVHAAGCSHYEAPSQGVRPEDMMRHFVGEDLNVGCVLTWGPCWYHQKGFFEGKDNILSTPQNLIRYDVEVSGFPSSHAGHLCLLRLTEDDYPNTTRTEEWPSWNLPILQWGKSQGAVVGFSHSGWGLQVDGPVLPNYNMPKFNGIGANEYIVDVTHDAVDFISAIDTPIIWELNIWYHTLNCGFTTRISGETDFPCIYGERVGLGRSYIKIPKGETLNFDSWVNGLRDGRSYVSDGMSHLYDFEINNLPVGEQNSRLQITSGDALNIQVQAAGLLSKNVNSNYRSRRLFEKPYWHIDRARIEQTRDVKVELIENGVAVAAKTITADGEINELHFDHVPTKSSWYALRIFPSSHTNPIFVEVDEKSIQPSRRSAEWCRKAVDVCWNAKKNNTRSAERPAAEQAYQHARNHYDAIIKQAYDDRKQ